MHPRVLLLLAATLTMIWGTGAGYADCTCRAFGRDFALGRSACLATNNGPRLAVCAMVLNNTSWRFSDTPCLFSEAAAQTRDDQGKISVAPKSQHVAETRRQGPGS